MTTLVTPPPPAPSSLLHPQLSWAERTPPTQGLACPAEGSSTPSGCPRGCQRAGAGVRQPSWTGSWLAAAPLRLANHRNLRDRCSATAQSRWGILRMAASFCPPVCALLHGGQGLQKWLYGSGELSSPGASATANPSDFVLIYLSC